MVSTGDFSSFEGMLMKENAFDRKFDVDRVENANAPINKRFVDFKLFLFFFSRQKDTVSNLYEDSRITIVEMARSYQNMTSPRMKTQTLI